MRIVLTGGGSGGHLTPFEPIIEALRSRYMAQRATLPQRLDPDRLELSFLGVANQDTHEFFATYDVPVTHIPSGKLRRYVSGLTIIDLLFRLPLGLLLATIHLWRRMPDVVVSKGGYGSFPIVMAAAIYRIPVLLHESDVAPGLANRRLARYATAIAVGFAETKRELSRWSEKVVVTGIPVRSSFGSLDQASARRELSLAQDELVLLILGGSQGAKQLNELVLRLLPSLITEVSILHVTGRDRYETVAAVAAEQLATSPRRDHYRAYPYLSELDQALTAADAVVARAGATTLVELARLQKPSLLIPLDTAAGDHQRKNAAVFERAGAARVLDPTNLGVNLFESSVRELLTNKALRNELAHNIAQFDRPEAAADIAALTFKLAQGLVPRYAAMVKHHD